MRALALVTGASSGIGEVFARKLAARGCDLVLVARRRERLEQLCAQLEKAHTVRCEALAADLTIDADLHRVEKRIASAEDLEYLVNNAGFGTLGRFFDAPVEGQDQMHRLHVLATVRLTHAALCGMVARRRGNVINVSSVAGFMQSAGNTSYCATKAWMNSFTEGLYLDLKSAHSRVRVQALCPGFTYSEFHDTLGVDRALIPRSMWLQAEFVVEESLRGLERGTLFVIPSWKYKSIVAFLEALPRPVRRAISGLRKPRRPKS